MTRIQESSVSITDIVAVIDGISFQTNLLALNAAVEAARAGEAGKGFAVGASEGRALAQRSAEAAKDIKKLIDVSAVNVADGVELVRETGNVLTRIQESIFATNEKIEQISTANSEQSIGISEVTRSVGELDAIVQDNAAAAGQNAKTAEALAAKSSDLTKLTQKFKTGDEPLSEVA